MARSLGQKIKDLRVSLGLTQKQFGEAIEKDLPQSTVSHWEQDKQRPNIDKLPKIAALANLTVEQFLGVRPIVASSIMSRAVLVTGNLQAGAWSDASDWPIDDQYEIPAPLPPEWDKFPVHARKVVGPSMNRIYPDGSYVFCVAVADLGRRPKPGERVAIQRVDQDGNYESTLKEYQVDDNGRVWLWPRSHDPEFQSPLPYVEHARKRIDRVDIVAVVIASMIHEARPK